MFKELTPTEHQYARKLAEKIGRPINTNDKEDVAMVRHEIANLAALRLKGGAE